VKELMKKGYTAELEKDDKLTTDYYYNFFNLNNFKLISNLYSLKGMLTGKIETANLF